MCGIGLVVGNDKDIRSDFAKIISNHQRNRGPDYLSIENYNEFTICHQRLSIVGLDKKFNQPYLHQNLILLFNGEIYNFREIARNYNLTKNSYKSDTACLAELINKIGFNNSIKIIDGMYSICVIDKSSKSINICVDDFGIKQLYFTNINNYLIIASTFYPLLEILKKGNSKITFDKTTKIWKSSFHGLPPGHTHIEEIKQLNQKYIYKIAIDGNIFSQRLKEKYFHYDSKQTNLIKELEEAANSDVNASLLLSGGIDSTSLLCASTSFKNSINCVTIDNSTKRDSGFSEDEYKNAISNASYLGFDIDLIKINKVNLSSIKKIFSIIDVPAEITGAIPLYFICKKIREKRSNIKYLISGLGADEIFFGYRGHRLSTLLTFIPRFILLAILRVVDLFSIKNKGLKRRYNFAKNIIQTKGLEKDLELFSFSDVNNKSRNIWQKSFYKKNNNQKDLLLKKYYDRCFDFFLAQCHLPAADRISMEFSFELRVPFLQKRIISKNYPLNTFYFLIKSLKRKAHLKKYISSKLKNNYKNITKSGFGTDSINLFSDDAIDYINDLISYGNKRGLIQEKCILNKDFDQRLFIHIINQAHYVFLLRKILD